MELTADSPITDLGLTTQAPKTLADAGIDTVEQLLTRSRAELAALKGMGARRLADLDAVMAGHRLVYGQQIERRTAALESPPPLIGAATWSAVMSEASQGEDSPRCQCEGACGQPHIKAAGRCPRRHGQYVKNRGTIKLVAGDPGTEGPKALTLPAEALRAWCPTCFDGARREARKLAEATAAATLATMEGLF